MDPRPVQEFFGRDRNSWPLVGNVQHVMSGKRRNKAIAGYFSYCLQGYFSSNDQ